MEENRLMYSHWATPFQFPAQLLIQGPDTLHPQIVSNTFIIYQDQDIFADNGILGHAWKDKANKGGISNGNIEYC
jgi:hypothetical protein